MGCAIESIEIHAQMLGRNEASQCPLQEKKITSKSKIRDPHPRPENRRIGAAHE